MSMTSQISKNDSMSIKVLNIIFIVWFSFWILIQMFFSTIINVSCSGDSAVASIKKSISDVYSCTQGLSWTEKKKKRGKGLKSIT